MLINKNKQKYFLKHDYHPSSIPAEKGLNYADYYYEDYWFVIDFSITFDHLTNASQNNYKLFFNVSLVEESIMNVDGTFEYITKSYSINGDKASKTATDKNGLKEFATKGKKFTEKIPSREKMQKTVKKAEDNLNKYSDKVCPNNSDKRARENLAAYLSDVSDDFEKGGELSNILLGLSDIGGIAGGAFKTIVGLYDMFSGKAKSTSSGTKFQPTISHGTVSLSGTITTEEPVAPIILDLPGTSHSGSGNAPYYDCPLGVFGLEQEPSILIRKWSESSVKYKNFTLKTFSPRSGFTSCNGNSVADKACLFDKENITEKWKSIRINSDLKIAVNAAAGVELTDCKVALVAKIRSIDKDAVLNSAAYILSEDEILLPSGYNSSYTFADDYHCFGKGCYEVILQDCRGSSLEDDNPWRNKTLRYLNDGFYWESNPDENGFIEFSTPLMDVENFKYTSMTIREETDLFIKVVCTFEANDGSSDDTPIILWNTYKITQDSENDYSSNSPYPFTRAQLVETKIGVDENIVPANSKLTNLQNKNISSGTYTNWGIRASQVDINTSGNVTFNAYNNVSLEPPFSIDVNGSNKFSAKIIETSGIINTNNTPISSIVNDSYFAGCNANLKSAKINNPNDELEIETFNFVSRAFPNPFSNEIHLYMNLRTDEEATVEIFNSMGALVHKQIYYNRDVFINVSEQDKGLYIMRIIRGENINIQKLMKQ